MIQKHIGEMEEMALETGYMKRYLFLFHDLVIDVILEASNRGTQIKPCRYTRVRGVL